MSDCSLPKCFPVSLPEGNIFEQFDEPKLTDQMMAAAQDAKELVDGKASEAKLMAEKNAAKASMKAQEDAYVQQKMASMQNNIVQYNTGDDKNRMAVNSKMDDKGAMQNDFDLAMKKKSDQDSKSGEEDDRIKALQDKLDLLTLNPKYGSGTPPVSSPAKSDSQNNMLIYIVVGFLCLIILYLLNEKK